MDVWDLYERIESPIYTVKVSDAPQGLSTLKVHNNGKLIAVGDNNGSLTVSALSRGLYEVQKDEKGVIAALFERETKREKNLDQKLMQKTKSKTVNTNTIKETEALPIVVVQPAAGSTPIINPISLSSDDTESVSRAETDFFTIVNENKSQLQADAKPMEEQKEEEPYEQEYETEEKTADN